MGAGALRALRVLDLSESIAGQFCGRMLADYGAAVTLVEPPGGSALRAAPPFAPDGESLLFFHLNTGKRSVLLDADAPDGEAALLGLAADADAVLLGPGRAALRRALRATRPGCVSVTVTPFGEDGPLASWQGSELVFQAFGGAMHNNGDRDRQPLYGCGHRASYAAGVAGYIGLLAALLARPALGRGQDVSVDIAETAATLCYPYTAQYSYNGTVLSRHELRQPVGQVRCRDGWICIWIYNHRWAALCRALELPWLEQDPRFATPGPRSDNWAALYAILQHAVADRGSEEVVATLQAAEVIAARSYGLTELVRGHHHLERRGYWQSVATAAGPRSILGPQFRMGRTPRQPPGPPPAPGAPGISWPPRPIAAAPRPAGPAPALPLAGLRIAEMTTAWAGPMAGRILAWLGAEVIHIEAAGRVNSWRAHRQGKTVHYPGHEPGERPWDRSYLFNSQNADKLSLTLDLKHPEGAALFRRMAPRIDAVLCNFRPGTLRRLGLDHAALSAIRPDIVVVEMPAYGNDGPMARHAALGPTMEMATGMSSLVGYADRGPINTGPSYPDPIGGLHGAAAMLTALMHRQASGEGQHVELPQVEAAMHFIGEELLAALAHGADPARDGNRLRWAAPHDAYPAAGEDRWIAIAVSDDTQWAALCGAIGRPELAEDPRFAGVAGRRRHADLLDGIIAAWTRQHDGHAAAAALQAAGVPAAPVQDARDFCASAYLRARGFFTELDHPAAGRHAYPGLPIHLSETPGAARRPAPCFGQDNARVLGALLGLDEAAVAALEARGVIAAAPL